MSMRWFLRQSFPKFFRDLRWQRMGRSRVSILVRRYGRCKAVSGAGSAWLQNFNGNERKLKLPIKTVFKIQTRTCTITIIDQTKASLQASSRFFSSDSCQNSAGISSSLYFSHSAFVHFLSSKSAVGMFCSDSVTKSSRLK